MNPQYFKNIVFFAQIYTLDRYARPKLWVLIIGISHFSYACLFLYFTIIVK